VSASKIIAMHQAQAVREYVSDIQDFASEYMGTVYKLTEMMGDNFAPWYDSYPAMMTKRDFLPIMKAKIVELRVALDDPNGFDTPTATTNEQDRDGEAQHARYGW